MVSFIEFMAERREVDRWFVLKVAMLGAFCGAMLGVTFMVVSMGVWFV